MTSPLAAAIALVTALSATSAAAAPHWGSFKNNGCVAKDLRAYSAVLWDIPWGASWETTCARTPARVQGHYFSHPTICTKASVTDPLSYVATLTSIGGLGYPPAGIAGTVMGTAALLLDEADIGALNMWGVFYVQDPANC